jgi:transketolase
VLGGAPVRIAIEAACPLGWERYTGPQGGFIGMHGFGASAPFKDLYRHFGITPEAAAEAALARIQKAK